MAAMTTQEAKEILGRMENGDITICQAREELDAMERRSASGERARMVSPEDEFQDDPEVQLGESVVAEED